MKNSPKSKDELLAYLQNSALENVANWSDFYNLLDRMYAMGKRSPLGFFDLYITMYAFMLAMRDLPDEGDITVLLKKAIQILVVEGEERLGIVLDFAPVPATIAAEVDEVSTAIEKRMDTDLQSLSLAKSWLSRIMDGTKNE